MIIKNIPYKSQWDNDATATQNDCGPASIAMILAFYNEDYSVDEVFEKTGAGQGYISFDQMFKAISSYGFRYQYVALQTKEQLKAYIDSGIPVVSLVKYGYLSGRQDVNFKGPHFLDVVGYDDQGVYTMDPNYWDSRRNEGSYKYYSWTDFMNAWDRAYEDGNPVRSLIVIYPKEKQTQVTQINDSEKFAAVLCDRIHILANDMKLKDKNSNIVPKEREKYIIPVKENKEPVIIGALNLLNDELESNKKRATITDSICIDYLQMPSSDNVTYEMIKTSIDTRMKAQLNNYVSIGTYQAMEIDRNKFRDLYQGAINKPSEPAPDQEEQASPVNHLQEYKNKYDALPGWLKWIVDAFSDTNSEVKKT